MYLGCQFRGVFVSSKGSLGVTIDFNDTLRPWHLQLEACIMGNNIKVGEHCMAEEYMVPAGEGDNVEDQIFVAKVVG